MPLRDEGCTVIITSALFDHGQPECQHLSAASRARLAAFNRSRAWNTAVLPVALGFCLVTAPAVASRIRRSAPAASRRFLTHLALASDSSLVAGFAIIVGAFCLLLIVGSEDMTFCRAGLLYFAALAANFFAPAALVPALRPHISDGLVVASAAGAGFAALAAAGKAIESTSLVDGLLISSIMTPILSLPFLLTFAAGATARR
ncbi:MAG: hypothetical protein GEU80_08220 [Dehalococcoidia bacterium]|nr:hypothetical protein [Dehalococcoidia bacterium]